jgi:DNA-binding LytR/AlgR family response regulator
LPQYGSYWSFFISILPYRILFCAALYIISVLSYYLAQSIHNMQKQSDEIAMIKNETNMPEEETLSRIAVKKNKEIRLISVMDILYIEANGDYVLIYTDTGRFLKDKTMKYLETHLPVDRFVRIHRSFIINIDYLVKLELYEKEMYQVQLKGGITLKTSNAGYKLLKQKLQ